ncbi:MAG: DUF29 domain-containing protein [Aquificota bacterium]|nr:DUF29 domain-containing protein [Aquificaceae bacterium]MDM7266414.1 DUF29 domain-containing protein [Aquificaceae bacterium]QWK12297.1 MAG: DUF29 domain-containing protein [Aquificota bacterium]HAV40757.1 DUF29 domain-containing protein [Aquificaceae bacterium]HCO38448.1 DUF29 domain-containing protein [Aquificaceae bacterium]
MRTISKEELKGLYEKDFPLWVEKNLELLRERAYDLVDWENLLEEIEDMARSDLKACVSYLAVVLEHLYKWDNLRNLTKAGEGKGGLSWIKSVEISRRKINRLFRESPSLMAKLPQKLDYAWEEARDNIELWLSEIEEDPDQYHIPEECPYTYEEAMTKDLKKEMERP